MKLSELIRSPAEYIQALREDRLDSLLEPYLKATDYFILVRLQLALIDLAAAQKLGGAWVGSRPSPDPADRNA